MTLWGWSRSFVLILAFLIPATLWSNEFGANPDWSLYQQHERRYQRLNFWSKQVQKNPTDVASHFHLANALHLVGHYTRAIREYGYVIAHKENNLVAMATLYQSVAYIKSGQELQGRQQLTALIANYPPPEILELAQNILSDLDQQSVWAQLETEMERTPVPEEELLSSSESSALSMDETFHLIPLVSRSDYSTESSKILKDLYRLEMQWQTSRHIRLDLIYAQSTLKYSIDRLDLHQKEWGFFSNIQWGQATFWAHQLRTGYHLIAANDESINNGQVLYLADQLTLTRQRIEITGALASTRLPTFYQEGLTLYQGQLTLAQHLGHWRIQAGLIHQSPRGLTTETDLATRQFLQENLTSFEFSLRRELMPWQMELGIFRGKRILAVSEAGRQLQTTPDLIQSGLALILLYQIDATVGVQVHSGQTSFIDLETNQESVEQQIALSVHTQF